MSKNNNKSSQYHDMWQNLLNNPGPSPAYSSTAPQSSNPSPSNTGSPSGFAQFSSSYTGVNPYSQPYYNQTGYHPVYGHYSPPFPPVQQPLQFSQYHNVETPPESEADAVPEPEPEVQPNPKQKRRVVKWSSSEARLLAQRWIDASENPVLGTSQSEEYFWNTIQSQYNSLVDEKRSKNQLTGKWSKIRRDVKIFGGIFKKHNQLCRQSGADDKAVYDAALAHFKDQTNRPFLYEACWHELKAYPKFWNDHGVMSQKRSFEDSGCPINLDEDELDVNPNPNTSQNPNPNPAMEALFQDDPIRRPPGRAASRKSQRSGSSSDATSSRISGDEAREQVTRTARRQEEVLTKIEENNNKKLLMKAFKNLNTPINENLSKRERKLLEKARQSMWQELSSALGTTSGAQDDDDDDDDDDE